MAKVPFSSELNSSHGAPRISATKACIAVSDSTHHPSGNIEWINAPCHHWLANQQRTCMCLKWKRESDEEFSLSSTLYGCWFNGGSRLIRACFKWQNNSWVPQHPDASAPSLTTVWATQSRPQVGGEKKLFRGLWTIDKPPARPGGFPDSTNHECAGTPRQSDSRTAVQPYSSRGTSWGWLPPLGYGG